MLADVNAGANMRLPYLDAREAEQLRMFGPATRPRRVWRGNRSAPSLRWRHGLEPVNVGQVAMLRTLAEELDPARSHRGGGLRVHGGSRGGNAGALWAELTGDGRPSARRSVRSSVMTPRATPAPVRDPRNPGAPTTGEVAATAAALGRRHPAPENLIADVAGELTPEGLPAYPEVAVVTTPRGQDSHGALDARRADAPLCRPGVLHLSDRGGWHPGAPRRVGTDRVDERARSVLRFRFARGDAGLYVQMGRQRLCWCRCSPQRQRCRLGARGCGRDRRGVGVHRGPGRRHRGGVRPAVETGRARNYGSPRPGHAGVELPAPHAGPRPGGRPGLAYFEWSAGWTRDYDPLDERLARAPPGHWRR